MRKKFSCLCLLWLLACGSALAGPGAEAPLWLDASGRPGPAAREALSLLAGAADEGLDPADYRAPQLAATAARLDVIDGMPERERADFDVALSTSVLRYLRQLHTGRIEPRAAGFGVRARYDEHDFAALLRDALAGHRLTEAAIALRPALGQYASLRAALARYRELAARDDAEPLPTGFAALRPGENGEGLRALQRRLVALGDLPADAPVPDDRGRYEGALVEGMQRFQRRHGLEPDGVFGKSTQAAMRVPLARRVRQIEFSLERLRWLPHLEGQRFVAINIPMFRLWAAQPGGAPPLSTGVIVGRALDTHTPVFIGEMRHVIFRPYWNVPRSIVRNELLPLIARDRSYLQRHEMEIVRGAGDDAQAVEPTAHNIALLRDGALRLRQRPGPRNSLGLVKFVFPNDSSVYLHGTPAPQLFGRARRDFSHGCVRVEDPIALAQWVLRDQPQWTRERIVAAMTGDRTLKVNLGRPLPVILYYLTAMVMPGSGELHFADDLYGHDARLERALAARRTD